MRPMLLLLLAACTANAGGKMNPEDTATLRAAGPAGLQRLLADPHPDDEAWRAEVDAVAAQKDAMYSGLYWYTDREAALAAAAEQGKPVLSLRMLGELTDTYSCANSRFFRTVLYANPEVAEVLERDFVLHWSSERAVPKITIDMGDGRQLVSTVTGNSAHYVLDTDGMPIDVLPGLYTPAHFLDELEQARAHFDELESLQDPRLNRLRDSARRTYHTERRNAALARLQLTPGHDKEQALARTFTATLYDAPRARPLHLIPASDALPMALGKMLVEQPMTNAFLIERPPSNALHPNDLIVTETIELHPITRELIRRDQPERGVEARFANALIRDSVWNRDVLHARIHGDMALRPDRSFEDLNAWVYANVFGTPAGDAWLGLYDPTVYSGLPGGGVTE